MGKVWPVLDEEVRKRLRVAGYVRFSPGKPRTSTRNMNCPFIEDEISNEKCEGLSGLGIEDSELQGDDVCRTPRLYERCPTYQRKIRGEKIRV